jgi:hypothetical protein
MKLISPVFRLRRVSRALIAIVLSLSIPYGTASATSVDQAIVCASVLNVAVSTPTPIEKRIADLHARLQITRAQESLWRSVAQVMRDNASAIDTLKQTRGADEDEMNAVESLRSYGEMVDAHADGIKKLMPAFEALYNDMSTTQKHNADLIFRNKTHYPEKQG